MEDRQIVELYWQRSELAIEATAEKYGQSCYKIAYNILRDAEDSRECVNDTYMRTWGCILPHRPAVLSAFLAKITRNLSLNRLRDKTREKRGGGQIPAQLDELSQCLSSGDDPAESLERKELSRAINDFLGTLPKAERDVFLGRYWFMATIGELSGRFGFSAGKIKSMLFRSRGKLRKYLQEEGMI